MTNNYDDKNIATMEMIYGEGYLSAGGDSEIEKIFSDLDVKDRAVLDVGCGLGGAVVVLARDLGANPVHGIDIDAGVLARASELVSRNKIKDKVVLTHSDPGPFPIEGNSFDAVHLTAVACHFDNLGPLFSEIHRVLRPGGTLVGRDWMKENDGEEFKAWDNLLRDAGLNFYFAEPQVFRAAFEQAGFHSVSMIDRTRDMALLCSQALVRTEGELRDSLLDVLGPEGYEDCVEWSRVRAQALDNGGISQYQFRAVKPE